MLNMFAKQGIYDLQYAMSVNSAQKQVLASNIANADTPFYRAMKLPYEEAIMAYKESDSNRGSLYETTKPHLQPVTSVYPYNFVRGQNNPSIRNDFNDVNLDFEMTELAKNSVRSSSFKQVTGQEFARLKMSMQSF